jgi:quercetin dioxygenase-like cupin family protein
MFFKELEAFPVKEVLPGFFGKFIHTENMTLAFWKISSGSILPEHSHIHEQVANITEGKFELTIEGTTRILIPGHIAIIPSGSKHSGKALTDCSILDVFTPKREDYQ